ncbi:hypothetical protein PAPYR_4412 [Paratrimastix pyriformis]|uniref:Uncharacterized protein n=1 Tax=Paratrimastix pyriformis TaxID=342808 RepID=A0ABQ8UPM6_9EUKA|nr:hypothetical protein PAPYR_4412 [Paratrimastix pyriformis]
MSRAFVALLLVALVTASKYPTKTRDFCPAHVTHTTFLGDGNSFSEVESCNEPFDWTVPHPPRANKNSIHSRGENGDPFAALPEWMGNIPATSSKPLQWKGRCFQQASAYLKVDNDGFTIVVDLANPKTFTCQEIVLFTTPARFVFHDFIMRGHHEIRVKGWEDADEKEDVTEVGSPVFVLMENILPSLMDVYNLYKTFHTISNATAAELVKFHKSYFDYAFKPRTLGLLDIPDSAVHSGDVFALHVMTPHETFDWLLTGSHSGHVAVAVVYQGKTYVMETTDATFLGGPPFGFHLTPFQQWKAIYASQGYEIAWLPIRRELSALIDKNMDRVMKWYYDHVMPFIVPSFGSTAIDTPNDNFPPPLNGETFLTLSTIYSQYDLAYMRTLMLDAINMRFVQYFNTSPCDNLHCAWERAFQFNVTLPEVVALPEVDGWRYEKGPSIVCAGLVSWVMRMGGVFEFDFNAGEQDPKDVIQWGIYETDWTDRPKVCYGSTQLPNEVPYCQIAGKWALELPEYNSVKPYPHMNDHCGASPPTYHRFPETC